jgi:hypothetical protein
MSLNPYEPPHEDQRPPRLNVGRFRHLWLVPFFAAAGTIPAIVYAVSLLIHPPPQAVQMWQQLPAIAIAGFFIGGFIGLVGAVLDILRYR